MSIIAWWPAILARDAELGEQITHEEELWKVLASKPDVAGYNGEETDQSWDEWQATDQKELNANQVSKSYKNQMYEFAK